mgnify:CR=1 FL=1
MLFLKVQVSSEEETHLARAQRHGDGSLKQVAVEFEGEEKSTVAI